MAALTAPRNTAYALGYFVALTAGGDIFAGGLVCANGSGVALAAADTAGLKIIGVAQNSAASGEAVTVRRGVFALDNDTSQPVTAASIGKLVYVLDDQTVTIAAGCTNAVVAGLFLGFDGTQCLVDVGNFQTRAAIAPVAALTGTVTGTADGVLENVAAAAGACAGGATPTATNVDSAIATAVAALVTSTNLQIKELMTKINAINASINN
jgi:hypothetical protein